MAINSRTVSRIATMPFTRSAAVSYTHLDVYKRQAKDHIPAMVANIKTNPKYNVLTVFLFVVDTGSIPVSYTHLDVYKRQT